MSSPLTELQLAGVVAVGLGLFLLAFIAVGVWRR